jgi:hypothetical protein
VFSLSCPGSSCLRAELSLQLSRSTQDLRRDAQERIERSEYEAALSCALASLRKSLNSPKRKASPALEDLQGA